MFKRHRFSDTFTCVTNPQGVLGKPRSVVYVYFSLLTTEEFSVRYLQENKAFMETKNRAFGKCNHCFAFVSLSSLLLQQNFILHIFQWNFAGAVNPRLSSLWGLFIFDTFWMAELVRREGLVVGSFLIFGHSLV